MALVARAVRTAANKKNAKLKNKCEQPISFKAEDPRLEKEKGERGWDGGKPGKEKTHGDATPHKHIANTPSTSPVPVRAPQYTPVPCPEYGVSRILSTGTPQCLTAARQYYR